MPDRHFYLLRHHIILYKISAFLFVGSRRNQDIRWNPYLPYLEYKIAGRIYAANVMDAGLNQNNFYNATVYYEYTANHKHTFVTYTYTYTNSCTEPGERVTKCKDCGYIQLKETLPAQGHDWEVVSEKKATCKAEGLRNLKCRRCGETKKVVLIKTHQFSSWQTAKDATVFAPAVQIRTCNVCGYKETRNNGKKLTATMKVNAVKLPLKIKQKTTVLKVSGLANGDSVASWKSGNTKVVKVSGEPNGTCTLAAGRKKGKTTITIILKSGLKFIIVVGVAIIQSKMRKEEWEEENNSKKSD